jgi:hypothetical protein
MEINENPEDIEAIDYRANHINNSLNQMYLKFYSMTRSHPTVKLERFYLNNIDCEDALFGKYNRIDSLIHLANKFAKKAVENMGTGRPVVAQQFIANYDILPDDEYLQKVNELTHERAKKLCIDVFNRKTAAKLEYELYNHIAEIFTGFKSMF